MKLYVGNLSFRTTTEDLQDYYAEFGEVTDAIVMTDRETGRSRGFGFVTFANKEDGERAIEETNGQDFAGRDLRVNEAQPRPERPAGGRGGFRGGNNRNGGGGGRDRY